jgi:GNAT superfamily N-acetyltransferase
VTPPTDGELPDGLRIRATAPDDARPIAAVEVATWQRAYRGLLDADYLASLSVGDRAVHWQGVIDDRSDDHLLVAVVASSVVGYAHLGPSRVPDDQASTGELYSLYLHPDHWGTGRGRAVHGAALARLGEDGFDAARLWMLSTNDRARRFYARLGWSAVAGVRTQWFGGSAVIDDRLGRRLPTG